MPRRASASEPTPPALVWFRQDLRLADHPALAAAVETGQPLLFAYVLDDETPNLRRLGGASRWWLHHSLRSLAADLHRHGATLHMFVGSALDVIPKLAQDAGASAAFWSRRYAAAEVDTDRRIEDTLAKAGIEVHSFNGSLGHEPDEVRPKTGGFYKVYSAYWKASQAALKIDDPIPAPKHWTNAAYRPKVFHPVSLDDLDLLPKRDWSAGLAADWEPGEAAAQRRLHLFVTEHLADYAVDRDRPAIDGSSRLSPHLRFGEISPRQVIAAAKDNPAATKFLMEIGWRDFAYSVLSNVSDIATESYDRKFRDFPWETLSPGTLEAWQRGRTGYPIVDAGMRQLWQTGWMHNRVRLITGSFFVKHLMGDWRVGEQWFWDTLCDADPADNTVNWQWVAGTGLDAAPYFRIFNPILQSEKFDPEGLYIKRLVPELAKLPKRWIHTPWEAPEDVLDKAGIVLGKDYPLPIVDHGEARQRALDAFAALRKGAKADA